MALNWHTVIKFLVPKNPFVKKRDTEWICSCDICQQERSITYAQAFNIFKKKSKRTCKSCCYSLGLFKLDISGLSLGRNQENQQKAIKNRLGIKLPKSKQVIEYRQLFNPESLSNDKMRLKQRLAKLGKYGELCNAWTGSTNSTERKQASARDDYKQLRRDVFSRDDHSCVICKNTGYLHMDHIKEWVNYPELRYDITNCRTLCPECHRKTDNYGSKSKKTSIKNGN